MPLIVKDKTELCFGTYRLNGQLLEIAVAQAVHLMLQHGIDRPLVDTALKYDNSQSLRKVLTQYPNIRIGTKVHRSQTVEQDLAKEVAHYGDSLFRVLLHRHMPVSSYLVLVGQGGWNS